MHQAAFADLVERHRHELRVHCYRMTGSFDEAEDLVQETFLRAWRGREDFEGRATLRTWLYRIATNTCLDALDRQARRPPSATRSSPAEVEWLQPYPDSLLAPSESEPDAVVVARETIELAFLAAIQHLPARQRAVLILRDVLGWPAAETATLLEMNVTAVKSALQRARATMKEHLPERRLDWRASSTLEEQEVLRRFIEASERSDLRALAAMLREDARQTMPPASLRFEGREAIIAMWTESWGDAWRLLPTWANRQPAAANYMRVPGGYEAVNLDVLRVENGQIVEITTFGTELHEAFGLPLRLDVG